MENDVAMFRKSGLSIAMGNASAEVKRHADATTLSNDEDGFAAAVERLILPRAPGGSGGLSAGAPEGGGAAARSRSSASALGQKA